MCIVKLCEQQISNKSVKIGLFRSVSSANIRLYFDAHKSGAVDGFADKKQSDLSISDGVALENIEIYCSAYVVLVSNRRARVIIGFRQIHPAQSASAVASQPHV